MAVAAIHRRTEAARDLTTTSARPFVVCLAVALLRRERFLDVKLNYWDESLAYVATAVPLDWLISPERL
jgi:hypothetical protein